MNFKTKMIILFTAVLLSLVVFNLITTGTNITEVMKAQKAAHPQVVVHVHSVTPAAS